MKICGLGLLVVCVLSLVSCSGGRSKDVVSQRYVHKYGIEVDENDWTSRGEDGQVITTLNNGVKEVKNYSQGVLEGEVTYSFPHSQTIHQVEEYEKGQLVKRTVNNENGWPREQEKYVGPNRKELVHWFESGAPQTVEFYENNQLVSGEYYSPDNQLESRIDRGDGMKVVRDFYGTHLMNEKIENGRVKSQLTFHPNGVLKSETPFTNGYVEGTRHTFLPSGEPYTTESWLENNQHGLTVVYKNGKVHREVPYIAGSRHGVEKIYDDKGSLAEEISWLGGMRHGACRTYVEGVVKTQWYYKDQLMPKSKHDKLILKDHS